MLKKHHPANLCIYIGLASISTYIAVIFSINILKYAAALTQIITLIISSAIIFGYKKSINWNLSLPILLVISFYPLFRIFIVSISTFDFKVITDGLIVRGGYYQLPIVGLAMAILTHAQSFNSKALLLRFSRYFFVIGVLLSIYCILFQAKLGGVGAGYLALDNCFIPISLLAFISMPKKYIYVGLLSIMSIIILSSLISSRSYLMIGLYFIIGYSILSIKTNKRIVCTIIAITLVFYWSGLFSFLSESPLIRNRSVVEKFEVDSFFSVLNEFLKHGDFATLFFWKGNSRADILIDAFNSFTLQDYLFGRGVFATYISFIERETIEMGWAQEIFWWGIPYVVLTICVLVRGAYFLRINKLFQNDPIIRALSVLILIRLLDSFIYGVPQMSVYNLLVFWGVMLQGVRKNDSLLKKIEFQRVVLRW